MRKLLVGHEIRTAYEEGWSAYSNGSLLSAAETAGFEALLTTDQNLRYQQNLTSRKIAIFVLPTTKWPEIRMHITEISAAIKSLPPGEYREITW